MLDLSLRLPHPPVLLYNVDTAEPTAVPITVDWTEGAESIGGLRAVWQVTRQRKVRDKWEVAEVLESLLFDVCNGSPAQPPGVTAPSKTLSVFLTLPSSLPPTFSTDFERVRHTVFLAALRPSPQYAASAKDVTYSREPRSIFGRWGKRKTSDDIPSELLPNIGVVEKQIKVVSPLEPKGTSPRAQIIAREDIDGLGAMMFFLYTEFMCAGSGFFTCCRFEELNPFATVYTVTISLEQCITVGKDVHVDRYMLQSWECAANCSLGYLWRGIEAKNKAAEGSGQGHSGSGPNELHLNGAPRLPSPALGLTSTSGINNSDLAPVTHRLILETTYTTLENGIESSKRVHLVKHRLSLSDCSLTPSTVNIPKYDSQHLNPDPEKYLEPYNQLTGPPSLAVKRVTFTLREGIRFGVPLIRQRVSADIIREHQIETNSFCMCFFESATNYPPPGSGLNLTDTMLLAPAWDDQDANHLNDYLENIRADIRRAWRQNHPEARQFIPGFLYFMVSQCPCGQIDYDRRSVRSDQRAKVVYDATSGQDLT
ncbi:hypothetical protein BD324DRAFT_654244 [Kockovaella imperatae]|uniref:Uncharacterized protein n=1 Tax=Kockovaella imperatae TaxID=4999 RepID=A0A1Y1U712_9TREE|nr:hypothetical protein BD324DRAFT_654244 [Kockovaella imperatae]ORX33324.1 hypothetical protein BD324DRAFT_654244 [Kockovaella imperatae]